MPYPPYFAYGSNMHPLRLGERVPSCRARGVAELPAWRLCFNKRGADHSAKCNMIHTGRPSDHVLGVVYDIAAGEKPALDRVEGGYYTATMSVMMDGGRLDVFTYLADRDMVDGALMPFDWYLEMVTCGAAHHRLPASYIQRISESRMMMDKNPERRRGNLRRLDAMRVFSAGRRASAGAASRQH
ncbi:MAG: gamma-glutamylcyclotransferase family protein [Mariprofundaceae bacterium]|nr:gamma-glutamylcyclotransferase family protein [Mariprofundaceae bacterium]